MGLRIFLLTGLLFSFSAFAVEVSPLSLNNLKLATPLKPGANGLMTLELELKKDHMAYVDQFRLRAPGISQLKNTKLELTPVQKTQDPHSGKIREVVSGKFKIKTVVEVPESLTRMPSSLDLELVYQACTKKYCYTPKTLKFSLPH